MDAKELYRELMRMDKEERKVFFGMLHSLVHEIREDLEKQKRDAWRATSELLNKVMR